MFFYTLNVQYKLVGGYNGVDILIYKHDKKPIKTPYNRYGKIMQPEMGSTERIRFQNTNQCW